MVPCFQDLSGIKINMQARAAELGGFDVNCSSSESPGIMKLESAAKWYDHTLYNASIDSYYSII